MENESLFKNYSNKNSKELIEEFEKHQNEARNDKLVLASIVAKVRSKEYSLDLDPISKPPPPALRAVSRLASLLLIDVAMSYHFFVAPRHPRNRSATQAGGGFEMGSVMMVPRVCATLRERSYFIRLTLKKLCRHLIP